MDFGDTQLIVYAGSPSRSSMSLDSTRYVNPMHEPKQLLYTQLTDQYEGRMDHNAHKRHHHPHLDLETQLIGGHNFDDFRKKGALVMPSEDEASKETQLIHGGDEGLSGSSSGKDGEVDSALSPFGGDPFSQKQSHWISEFTHRDRIMEGVGSRGSHLNFPFRDRYLGETQLLSHDRNGLETHNHSVKEQKTFRNRYFGETQILPDDGHLLNTHNHSAKDQRPLRERYIGETQILPDDGHVLDTHNHLAKGQRPFRERYLVETQILPDDGHVLDTHNHSAKDQRPFRDRYLGETQILPDDGHVLDTHSHSAKDQRPFSDRYLGETQILPDVGHVLDTHNHVAKGQRPSRERYLGETQILSDDMVVLETHKHAANGQIPFRDRYFGETQILCDDAHVLESSHNHALKGQRPCRERYLGDTQVLSDVGHVLETHNHLAKDQMPLRDSRAGSAAGGPPDLHNRDVDVPHFLRDFDQNRQAYAGQVPIGNWQEVTGQSEDRGWESAVRSFRLVDSDASTEDEEQNRVPSVFSRDLSYPGEAQMSQNVNPRLSTPVSNLFCKQDLNKSPEPEFMVDGWEGEHRADLVIGRIDEGGSNVDLLEVVEQAVLQSAPMETKSSEGLSGRIARAPPLTMRTGGSIRAASLRAAALQASACSSSGRQRHSTHQGSKSEEVQNVARCAPTTEMPRADMPEKAAGSSGDTTSMSRITMERGPSAASFPSAPSYSSKELDSARTDKAIEAVKVLDSVHTEARQLSKSGTSMQGEASSLLGVEVSKPPAEKSPSSARKLNFSDDASGLEKRVQSTAGNRAEAQSQPPSDRLDRGKENHAEPSQPRGNYLSPRKSPREKSLERRSSFGSGLFSTGSDMSYLSTQSPGEESQARALNMVDKLVWLNNIGLPQELQLEEEKAPLKGGPSTNAKSLLQSRVQVAEAKAGMDDPFGVFDWVDSQDDPFGGGPANANASKAAPKALVDVGLSNRQSGVGSKKGSSVGDLPGNRNKKADKLPEKAKFAKPTSMTDKHKGLAPKIMAGGTEIRREQRQGMRSGNGVGAVDSRQEQGSTDAAAEAALDFTDSHEDRGGSGASEKRSTLSDKPSHKLGGGIDNSSTADKARLVSTWKVPPPHWQKNKPREATRPSKDSPRTLDLQEVTFAVGEPESSQHIEDGPPSAQSRSVDGPNAFHDASPASFVAKASVDHDQSGLQEASTSDKTDEEGGLMQQDTSVVESSLWAVKTNAIKTSGRSSVMAGNSPSPHQDGTSALPLNAVGYMDKSPSVSLEHSPRFGKAADNTTEAVNLHDVSDPHDQQHDDALEKGRPFETFEQQQESSTPKLDGAKIEPVSERHPSRLSGVPEGCAPASRYGQTLDDLVGRDSSVQLPIPSTETGPATKEAKLERAAVSPTSSSTPGSSKVSPKEEGKENTAFTSETTLLRNDAPKEEGEEGNPKLEDDIQSAPPHKKATRRGRSQTRYSNAKLLDKAGPPSGSTSSVSRDKGRGRRVTWAGPLVEHLRQQNNGSRPGPRSPKQEIEARDEDVAESSDEVADSSGQDEHDDTDDFREDDAPKPDTSSRKRSPEALDDSSRYNDLDKIKRRFNMSDAAVARLLGTDEEEDADLVNDDEATGVKVRSLSHIHLGADGNGEESAVPNFRRVSKGLRSVRSRSEEGLRRPWPFMTTEQGKCTTEDVLSPADQTTLAAGNGNGTGTVDGHPSDNEFIAGRRRMRSIADVSFSNLPHAAAVSGRPPLARGLRRKRCRQVIILPPEAATDPSDDDLPPSVPTPLISPALIGKFRGKVGPRSARKRKEPEHAEPLPSTSEVSMSPSSSKEVSPTGCKRRKRTGAISVLLSHGLNEDAIKLQRKIVTRLGGRVATSASDCSHFVADKFVRTGNMLEAMASGKPVVNIGWLETCSEANRFVDEEEFILQDARKEEEMGFSMMSTLAGSRQRPLLQGIRVYITPGTSPGPDALATIVKSAGGQVVDEYCGPAADGEQESNFCVVISSEEEFEECIPLLEQGAKVFTPELILSGVTSYHLDFSNDQLFRNFTLRRRRGSSSRRPV